jgi:hypothetical protein
MDLTALDIVMDRVGLESGIMWASLREVLPYREEAMVGWLGKGATMGGE